MKLLYFGISIVFAVIFVINLDSLVNQSEAQTDVNKDGILFYDNFTAINPDRLWLNVSGSWHYDTNGLHGGKNDSSPTLLNNVLISPVSPVNESISSTSFKINDIFRDGDTAHYGSIVYDFVDPDNYKHAGINIYHDDVYVVFSSIINGTIYHAPSWLGNKTSLTYKPGSTFNMSLVNSNGGEILTVNGTKYYNDKGDNITKGYVGLNHGKVKDIQFLDFEIKELGKSHPEANQNESTFNSDSTNKMMNEINQPTSDSVGILLDDKSLPSEGYIYLYDSTPYHIVNGHVVAKIPCDENGLPLSSILIGQSPEYNTLDLDLVSPLSEPDELCMYNSIIKNDSIKNSTEILLMNNSTDDIDFPSTSSVSININKLAKH